MNTEMEKIAYKALLEFVEKYNEEATRIFNKLKEADHEANAIILDYGRYSVFERTEWYCSNEKYIIVRYYDDCDNYEYVSSTLMIPADILFDDAKIDKWIKSKIDEALEKKEEKRKAAEQRQEEKERQEYERLKEKFGKYFIQMKK